MNKYSITSLIIAKQNIPIGIVNLKKCLENDKLFKQKSN